MQNSKLLYTGAILLSAYNGIFQMNLMKTAQGAEQTPKCIGSTLATHARQAAFLISTGAYKNNSSLEAILEIRRIRAMSTQIHFGELFVFNLK